MKIKILTSCTGVDFSFMAGQEIDISAKQAKDLIEAGHAEEVKPEGKSKPSSSRTGK